MERRQMALEEQAEQERRARLTPEEAAREEQEELEAAEMSRMREERQGGSVVDRDFDQPFEDDPAVYEEYKPAETWDGLEHVGSKGDAEGLQEPSRSYEP